MLITNSGKKTKDRIETNPRKIIKFSSVRCQFICVLNSSFYELP